MKFETLAIHAGQEADPQTGAVTVPVYQVSTFKHDTLTTNRGWSYSRTGNPTRAALEQSVAALEGGKYGLAFASGLAAESAVLSILKPGDEVLAGDNLYGGTYRLLEEVFGPKGIKTTYVNCADHARVRAAINPQTRLIWLETPANPLLQITDISAIASIAAEHHVPVLVDNTFATPYFQTPLALGATIVLHSATKYIGGHSDVLGGVVVTSDTEIYERVKFHQHVQGAVPGPWDCWLMLRGIKTLPVRMREHETNAHFLAQHLQKHPAIEQVYYPGLEHHHGHRLARQQMKGFGGVISVRVKGGLARVEKFAQHLKLFSIAGSLGGVESLVCQPATMTHASLTQQERIMRGITDDLIRMSVGLENRDDLLHDITQALDISEK